MNNTAILLRLQQARTHFSHPTHFFGDLAITGHSQLDEYLSTLLLTLIFAFALYFSLSTISYLVFFKIWKQRFAPDKA